jgi:hypothetical protein
MGHRKALLGSNAPMIRFHKGLHVINTWETVFYYFKSWILKERFHENVNGV